MTSDDAADFREFDTVLLGNLEDNLSISELTVLADD